MIEEQTNNLNPAFVWVVGPSGFGLGHQDPAIMDRFWKGPRPSYEIKRVMIL